LAHFRSVAQQARKQKQKSKIFAAHSCCFYPSFLLFLGYGRNEIRFAQSHTDRSIPKFFARMTKLETSMAGSLGNDPA